MARFAPLLLSLVCSTLAAGEMVTPELPVSAPRPVPDPYTSCSVAAGATKPFALCSTLGGGNYRIDLESDGKPILATRVPFEGQFPLAVGDDLFTINRTQTSVSVRKTGSAAEARIDDAVTSPALVSNGGSLLLLTYTSGSDTMGAIIDTSLRIVVPPFRIMAACTWWPTRASAGGGFMVVNHDVDTAVAMVIDPDGTLHPVPLPSRHIDYDAVTGHGGEYLYVSQALKTPVVAQRYSAAGEPIGGPRTIADNTTALARVSSAVWSGGDYVILWSDTDSWYMRALNGPAQRLGWTDPYLSSGPAGVFLVQREYRAAQTIRRLDTNTPKYVLSYGMAGQWNGAIATDGIESSVLWTDGLDVRIGRIRVDGTQVDGPGTVVRIDFKSRLMPAMACDGVTCLVVWNPAPLLKGFFFLPDGSASEPFQISQQAPQNDYPGLTWTGTHYLVTFAGQRGQGTGAMVTTSGVATPFQFAAGVQQTNVAAASRNLVVYADLSEFLTSKIAGVFLDAAGFPFDVARESTVPIATYVWFPRVVSNGRDFLVTWSKQIDFKRSEAWVARLDDHGRVTGKPFLAAKSDASNDAVRAIPLFDGVDYRIVVAGDPKTPLFTAPVTDATFACGCFDDAVAIPMTNFDFAGEARSVTAAARNGTVVVAYERTFNNDPLYGSVPRVFLRYVRDAQPPRRRAASQ